MTVPIASRVFASLMTLSALALAPLAAKAQNQHALPEGEGKALAEGVLPVGIALVPA